jgi:hypothetical protein
MKKLLLLGLAASLAQAAIGSAALCGTRQTTDCDETDK